MKNRLNDALRIIIKSCLAMAIFVVSWNFLTPYFRMEHNDDGDYFRNLPEGHLDVLALGSSHIQYAFDPGVFYTETGLYSYVMGSSCQPMETSYYMIKEVLKTQHPSVIILDVFTMLPQSSVCYADGMYYKAIDMMEGENRIEAGLNIPVKEVRLAYAFDLIMNHSNWKYMDFSNLESIKEVGKKTEDLNWILGFVRQDAYDFKQTPLEKYQVTQKVELSVTELKSLDNIKELCKENGITLILTKTPYAIDQESTNKLASIKEYCLNNDIKFVDFIELSDELGWYLDLHGDAWHNNSWGAEIVTKYLSSVVDKDSLLSKHKPEETWDTLMGSGVFMTTRSLLSEGNIDVNSLIETAHKYPSEVVIRYIGNNNTVISEKDNQSLKDFGINFDFIKNAGDDYFAVIVNNKVLVEDNKPIEVEWNNHVLTSNYEGIYIDGEMKRDKKGNLSIYFMDENITVLSPREIDTSSKFWDLGCEGWNCSY